MGQQVYVLMMLEGGGKTGNWRPVAVVTDLSIAEQWQQSGALSKQVDWVPLELDDVDQIFSERGQRFQPQPLSSIGQRWMETAKELTEANEELRQIIDKLMKQQKRQNIKPTKASLLKKAEDNTPPPVEKIKGGTQPFPNRLDAQGLADYIETYANYPVDNQMVYEKFQGSHAVLKLMPIVELREGGRDSNLQSKANEAAYLKQSLKTQPPAVVEN